jgi:hypothetical protein
MSGGNISPAVLRQVMQRGAAAAAG